MRFSRWSFAGAILVLAALPLDAQETKIRTIGAGLDDSIIRISSGDLPGRIENSRGLLISDKGEILTAWRNVCISGNLQVAVQSLMLPAKLIGVHPSRDLAVIQVDLSAPGADRVKLKPAKLSASAVNVGDQILLWRYQQPLPAIVSGDTQPVDHPEYFWMTGKDTTNVPFSNGWAHQPPYPDDWVLNTKGEIQGMVARVLVNGALTLRVIPLHDVQVEEFIAPSKRQTDPAKSRELMQMAETVERDKYKPGQRPVFGWAGGAADYLRQALVEDPTNKDLLFKMGLTAEEVKSSATGGGSEGRKAPDPAQGKSNEQVESEFIKSRVNTAMELLKSNQLKIAQSILQDVVDNYPKHPEAKTAQRLLDVLKGKK
jgi:hypothetical protein